jgi:hypothetical protein
MPSSLPFPLVYNDLVCTYIEACGYLKRQKCNEKKTVWGDWQSRARPQTFRDTQYMEEKVDCRAHEAITEYSSHMCRRLFTVTVAEFVRCKSCKVWCIGGSQLRLQDTIKKWIASKHNPWIPTKLESRKYFTHYKTNLLIYINKKAPTLIL